MHSIYNGIKNTVNLTINKVTLSLICALVGATVFFLADLLFNGATTRGLWMIFGDIGLTVNARSYELGAAMGLIYGFFRDPVVYYQPCIHQAMGVGQ